ncbi:MAG: winged helix-turn-helix transcriptional regulator [Candidatus Micrarchaeia archaeon]
MSRIKRAFLILLFISLSFPAMTMVMSGQVDASGNSILTIQSNFSSSEGRNVSLALSAPLDSVSVKDRSGLDIAYTLRYANNTTYIYATVPVDYLEFVIKSDSLTAKDGPDWNFDLGIGSSENISSFNGNLSLPPGTILKSTNGAVTGGESLSVEWAASGIDPQHKARLKAGYELSSQQDRSLVILSIVIALSVVVIFYFVRRKPEKTAAVPTNHLESDPLFKTLDETDKEIIREIAAQKGKTTQAHLYLHTHVPKATLSRRIASLANKGILVKSQKGNRNLITLGDVFGK